MVDHAESAPPEFGVPSQASWASRSDRSNGDHRRLYLGWRVSPTPWPQAGRAWRRHAFTAFAPTSRRGVLTARHSGEEKRCSGDAGAAGVTADQLVIFSRRRWCAGGSHELDSLCWRHCSRLDCGRAWESRRRAPGWHPALAAEQWRRCACWRSPGHVGAVGCDCGDRVLDRAVRCGERSKGSRRPGDWSRRDQRRHGRRLPVVRRCRRHAVG